MNSKTPKHLIIWNKRSSNATLYYVQARMY